MEPGKQSSVLWRPPILFVVAYLSTIVLASSFALAAGSFSLYSLGNTIRIAGAAIAIVSFFVISDRSARGFRGIAVHPHDHYQNPIRPQVFAIILAALAATATGWGIVNWVACQQLICSY